MFKTCATILFTCLSAKAFADPSWFFVNPPTPIYFEGPPGKGVLKICKVEGYPDNRVMKIPMGTFFEDGGPKKNSKPGTAQDWLLTIETTKSAKMAVGQTCVKVPAQVAHSSPPPAHPELKSVMRFEQSDDRYFEVAAPEDTDAPLPDLAPWNPKLPPLKGTAVTDFK